MTTVKALWGPAAIGAISSSFTSVGTTTLNDADNAVGWMFNVPKDGSITDVGFLITATGGTPPAYNVGIVTQDSSGKPTTTPYGSSAIASYTPTSTGWKWVTLGTAATTASAGDFAAVHVYPTGTAPTGVNFITVARDGVADMGGMTAQFTTAWAASSQSLAGPFAIKYATGEIYGLALSSSTTNVSVSSSTTPDEVGVRFTLPAAMTVYGARITVLLWGASTTATVTLYDAADGVLASTAVSDKDYVDDSIYLNAFFDSVNLSANTTYRLTLVLTTASSSNIAKWSLESTTARNAIPEGSRWYWTQRTDAGAWSDDTSAIAPMGLWVSDITFVQGTGTTGAEWGFVG